MTRRERSPWLLAGFAAAGALASLWYISWWAEDDRYRSPLLLLVLAAALLYLVLQMVSTWIVNLVAQRTVAPPPPAHAPLVDVFVTAFHEPPELVRQALTAALALRGSARVWLLDDGSDGELHQLANQLGCGYLARTDQIDAKAGNINAALAQTSGEIVAIFDIDHTPRPDFLEKSLGYFVDPRLGFVQVMLTFRNFGESWVAHAASESSLEFYNPTYLGANRLGAASLMGSNALIRRTALASIGGYQPGLAEDLATSLALHAAGWRSAYVAEPLAPGLSPSSLSAWSVQQLKWARGVFELLLTVLPCSFGRLTWGQRVAYSVRMTKYWIGPAVFLHLAATIGVLLWGDSAQSMAFHSYLLHLAPLLVVDSVIRGYAWRHTHHEDLPPTSMFGAVVLVYASWPVYLLAWTLAVLRLPLRFRSTPKERGRLHVLWLLPQLSAFLLLLAGIAVTTIEHQHASGVIHVHRVSVLLAFAAGQALLQLLLLVKWFQEDRLQPAHATNAREATLYAQRNS